MGERVGHPLWLISSILSGRPTAQRSSYRSIAIPQPSPRYHVIPLMCVWASRLEHSLCARRRLSSRRNSRGDGR